jgi:hypothetical protein
MRYSRYGKTKVTVVICNLDRDEAILDDVFLDMTPQELVDNLTESQLAEPEPKEGEFYDYVNFSVILNNWFFIYTPIREYGAVDVFIKSQKLCNKEDYYRV